jgi:tRNA threonylcarbamoyladenosine biosynthesis protein TsaB
VIVLALDGALGAFSVAAARDGTVIASEERGGNVALERGLAMVDGVMRRARLHAEQIDRLAVGIGPGGFTGLRIAVSYAKSLAAAWERPLVPVGSFDLIEFGGRFDRVLAVVVGRPGVISARYRSGSEDRRASGRIADVFDDLLPASDAGTLDVVGAPKDALDALAERGFIVHPLDPAVTPAASAAALAAASLAPAKSLHAITADYGELPAAKPPKS